MQIPHLIFFFLSLIRYSFGTEIKGDLQTLCVFLDNNQKMSSYVHEMSENINLIMDFCVVSSSPTSLVKEIYLHPHTRLISSDHQNQILH